MEFPGSITMTETCYTSKGEVAKSWTFVEKLSIILPITCALSSTRVNCGAMRFTDDKSKDVHVEPERMEEISFENLEEEKSAITIKDLKVSTEDKITHKQPPLIPKQVLGIPMFYWIPIGISSAIALLIIGAIAKHCLGNFLPSARIDTNTTASPSPAVNISQVVSIPTAIENTQVISAAPSPRATIASGQTNTAPPAAPSSKSWIKRSIRKPARVDLPPTYQDAIGPALTDVEYQNEGNCKPLPLEVELELKTPSCP